MMPQHANWVYAIHDSVWSQTCVWGKVKQDESQADPSASGPVVLCPSADKREPLQKHFLWIQRQNMSDLRHRRTSHINDVGEKEKRATSPSVPRPINSRLKTTDSAYSFRNFSSFHSLDRQTEESFSWPIVALRQKKPPPLNGAYFPGKLSSAAFPRAASRTLTARAFLIGGRMWE